MPRMPILIRVYYFRQPVDVEDSAACDDTNLLDRIILPDTFQCTQIRGQVLQHSNSTFQTLPLARAAMPAAAMNRSEDHGVRPSNIALPHCLIPIHCLTARITFRKMSAGQ